MSAPVITPIDPGCPYIGNPAVYQITPTGAGVGKTFYQAKMKVVANLGNNDSEEFSFSTPIEAKTVNGVLVAQPAYFDISSAMRAVAEQWRPTSLPGTYPSVYFYVEAKEEWMVEGAIQSSDTARYPSSGVSEMYMGALTDRERITGSESWPSRYSRKPFSSREICFHDYQVIVPGLTSSAPAVTLYLAGDPGEQSFDNLNYYVISPPPDGYEIRFINALGVHENVFVFGLPQKQVNITTEQYVIARQETLTQFSRGLAIKKNDYETWALTSGPLDEQWASWYIHDFLMARWMWIKISGQFVPCHVIPEDTTMLTDRVTPSRQEVQFQIRLDINGSPL